MGASEFPWPLVEGRFRETNGRIDETNRHVGELDDEQDELKDEVQDLKSDLALAVQRVTQMTSSFDALRTALYATAGLIIAAAALLVILGR